MNPRRQLRRLREDDRWVGLPPARLPLENPTTSGAHRRGTLLATGVALAIAGVVAVALWSGLSGLRAAEPAQPAALAPLPGSSVHSEPVRIPCTQAARLAPIGCSTYTAVAAAGVPGGTTTWTGASRPTFAVRVLNGEVTAVVDTGCNGLSAPITITSGELIPRGSITSTAMGCSGARSAQERWLLDLLAQPVRYTVRADELRLSSGGKVLDLVVAPTATRSPDPAPSRTAAVGTPPARTATGAGCPATTAGTPSGASTAVIADVDGDRKPDTEWAVQLAGGTVRFGITTASGATASARQGFAGGGDRSFVVGRLANGVVVAITSERRDSPVFTFSGCAFHVLRGPDLLPGTGPASPFTLYSDDAGGDGGCYDGRLALTRLERVPGDSTGDHERAVARFVDVSRDGRHATITDRTATVATGLDVASDPRTYQRYNGISCGTSPVLHPVFRAG